MTITVAFATVADSIAGLTYTGITAKDIDQIPDNAELLCPIFFPQPNDFVMDIQSTFQSFGSNGTAKIDLSYTLNYVYLHCKTGGIGAFEANAGLIANIAVIVKAILSNDAITGAVDIVPQTIQSIGVVEDPAGNQFWGALFSFRVLEFSQ